ncbi:MAG: hypothetical protein A2186_03345 [Candidatus Levybacteria bacterium RIFOXYA1_FULL_41_10]|nr:MAG: hypothetical protein US02_C0001G0005 [Candidatus Levybacteria bacterium GW2011_GWA2_36_13]KKR17828.1 MAG: hypothetical protein UT44_C0002G0018 [Candidatus Levybacteria bacterium GW2011_GWA1_39_32]KKR51563.1 MAG: hypothetical protein UT87_C0004G0022 [Candidatus Levybacteria bacterium GW2011_GWC1_40_19]KKR73274.1 MAG: hypothetical protein UU15_C0014G0007 [Candidatus Levybacteria bacterium GW2011_GWC2_40_7]KKS02258.1 MAG: hypothetical protein UU52_C0002G0005 [Candidatus Levybacteria bacter
MVKDAPSQTPDIVALNASIADIQAKSSAYIESASKYTVARDEVSGLMLALHDEHSRLWLAQHDLINERERQLRAQLDSQGLAICLVEGASGWVNPHTRSDSIWTASWDELNKLGVFPKDQMTMVYKEGTSQRKVGGAYGGFETYRYHDFQSFCPEHAPEPERKNYKDSEDQSMWTRAQLKDGKYVREVDGEIVYDSPDQGKVQQALYEHFGYPPIPEIPEDVR